MMSEHVHKFDPNGMSLPRLQHGTVLLIGGVAREICLNQ